MDVVALLIAHLEPSEAVQPGQCALNYPAISTEPLAGLDTPASNAWDDATSTQGLAAHSEVIALVSVQLARSFAGSSSRHANRLNRINGRFQHLAVMHIGCRLGYGERDALPVDHNMALRARFPAIRRIRAGLRSPPGAGTLAESSATRVQSILSASPRRSSNTW